MAIGGRLPMVARALGACPQHWGQDENPRCVNLKSLGVVTQPKKVLKKPGVVSGLFSFSPQYSSAASASSSPRPLAHLFRNPRLVRRRGHRGARLDKGTVEAGPARILVVIMDGLSLDRIDLSDEKIIAV